MPESIRKPVTTPMAPPSSTMTLGKKRAAEEAAGLKQACNEFESLFIQHMMQQMRKTVPRDSLLGGGQAEEIYTGMLDGEMAKEMTKKGGIGMSSLIYERLAGLVGNKK